MPISFSSPGDRGIRGHGVTAVLGPTNTGKTHLAIERMLAHSSGVIGLPLRLLAREVYNKVAERAGADAVALVTGEEKIKPANPRYWVSTVEAMPRDLDVAFLAIDEVQLGADLERGHVFTDRMLNRRGREETLVLGAATVRPMVEKLLPGANILSRPRLSQLTHAGEKKITRQPRRTAIVAFSADEVYAIAELIRRQRGGAAVVLGALSPRTRNAQVALYQSGDVDYLVATDAIGMGLNLDVDHVAFASDRKFDGYQFRRLNPAEFAQIAGRAGRATRNGSFGTTGRCPPFDAELVHALESHSFEPVKILQWRSSDLDFSSLGALAASLAALPGHPGLSRAPIAEDILVFEHAARDEDVRALAKSRAAIERLWDVCQIPDYRKISPAAHAELVVNLYGFLIRDGKISDDWFARQIAEADHVEGDIDTLSTRIAHIRTWTFAANRPDWLADPVYWQQTTRAIEDRLSDALHERLTERFVDRRTSVLMRRLRENTMLETQISKTGEVVVEGHAIGRLDGFRFAPDTTSNGSDAKALSAAAQKALAGEIEARASKLAHAPDSQFVLTSDATIRWLGEPVAKLVPGDVMLRPRLRLLADEQLTGAALESVQARLDLWLRSHIERQLAPLFVLGAAEDITGLARGIAYQLVEALGVLERSRVADDLKSLDQASRATLRKHGVRFGAYHVYIPMQLKPAPRALAAQLWALKHATPDMKGFDDLLRHAASGRTSFAADKELPRALYRTLGYRVCGERAVRVDILERLADLIRPALGWRPGSPAPKPPGAFEGTGFTVTQAMTSLTGSSGEDFASILRALGYRMEKRPRPAEPTIGEPGAPPAGADMAPAADVTEALSQSEPAAPSAAAGAAGDGADAETAESATPVSAEHTLEPVLAASGTNAASTEHWTDAAAEPEPIAAELESSAGAPDAPTQSASEELEVSTGMAGLETGSAETDLVRASSAEAAASAGDNAVAPSKPAAESQPELVEVWRPGGRDRVAQDRRGQRRPPRRHRQDSEHKPPREAKGAEAPLQPAAAPGETGATTAATPAVGAPAATGDAEQAGHPHGHRRGPRREFRAREETGERRPEGREARGERPERPRPERQGRQEGQDRADRPDRSRGEHYRSARGRNEDRSWREHLPRRERDKEPDPDSPFAKLAALKAQLEANAKEGR